RNLDRFGPGEAIEIPAGAAHTQLPVGNAPGHVRATVTPAGRTEAYLRRLAAMSSEGQFDRAGRPRPAAGARMLLDFSDVGYATLAPLGPQLAAARALLAIAAPFRLAASGSRAAAHRIWRRYEFVDEWEVHATPEAVYDVLLDASTY